MTGLKNHEKTTRNSFPVVSSSTGEKRSVSKHVPRPRAKVWTRRFRNRTCLCYNYTRSAGTFSRTVLRTPNQTGSVFCHVFEVSLNHACSVWSALPLGIFEEIYRSIFCCCPRTQRSQYSKIRRRRRISCPSFALPKTGRKFMEIDGNSMSKSFLGDTF